MKDMLLISTYAKNRDGDDYRDAKQNRNVYQITGREGPEREQSYSSTLPLTSAPGTGGWSTPRSSRFNPGKETRYSSKGK